MMAAKPPPISTPAFTEFGTKCTILPPIPVIPNTRKIRPRINCIAISAWVRSGPISYPSVRKAVMMGMAGVIHPGTTGSPSNTCRL